MKKYLMSALFVIGIVNAGWVRVIGSSNSPLPPEKDVIKSDTLGVFIRTVVFGFTKNDTLIDNKNFQRIEITDEQIDRDTTRAGKPQIPYIKLLIAVPDSCGFKITVYPVDYTLFNNYLIYPIPRIIFEDSGGIIAYKEIYTYDTAFYQKDTLYPNKFYEIKSDGHWRDQRVLEVLLYPVQFNPQKKLMYFYTGIDLKIEYTGKKFVNTNGLGPFEDIGREILLNYPGIDIEPGPRPPPSVHFYTDLLNTSNVADYIIVTHYDFLNNKTTEMWIYNFAQWRVDHNQFDVGIVKVQDIYEQFPQQAPDCAVQLRDFLIYAYEHWQAPSMPDGHFAYCLFIGDWDYVPIELRLSGDFWNAYEGYFRDFTSDNWEDIMLGRWPVKEKKYRDLITIAQKTINYEKYPTLGDWRRRGLLIAGPGLGYWQYCNPNVDRSIPYFVDIKYDTFTVRHHKLHSDPDTANIMFPDTVHKYLNYGEIITAFYGHGGLYGWNFNYGNWYAEILNNNSLLPVILSYACRPAGFHFDHPCNDTLYPEDTVRICFGECILQNPNGGAVAFYGGTSPIFMNLYTTEPTTRILRNQEWILGKALVNATPNTDDNCFCLLGDPALDLGDYTAYPDLPDLVVRPQGIDISLLPPYPYTTSGDLIPIRAKIMNIGHMPAYNVEVNFRIGTAGGTFFNNTVVINEVQPRDSAVALTYWNTGLTHPNFYGEIGDCDIAVKVDPNNVITESWEYNNQSSIIKKVALYPNEPNWPKQITGFSQPAIANLDNTGAVEIVYASLDSIYIFNYNGSIFTGWPKYFPAVYGLVLADIDTNGYLDIAAVSQDSLKVYFNDGTNITSAWTIPVPVAGYIFTGLPAIGRIEAPVSADLNIVLVAWPLPTGPLPNQPLKIFVYDYSGILKYTFTSTSYFGMPVGPFGPSIADVTSAGNKEIIISYQSSATLSKTEIFNYNGLVTALGYGSNQMTSALADLNGDNYAEMITGGIDKKIHAYDAQNNQLLWERQTEGPINCSPAVGDIYPLPYAGVEVTFGNDASAINLREKSIGDPIPPWSYIISPSTYVRTSPAIANINRDRFLDIIIGANNQYIYAFKYDKTLIPPFPLPLFGRPSSPLIGDIDGDRRSEIILSSSDGYLHIWKNRNSRVPPYSLEWPQFHHDYQRTGLYGWVEGLFAVSVEPKEFSTSTTIYYTLKEKRHIRIRVYDSEGEMVKKLVNETQQPGSYQVIWDGTDDNNDPLANGLYLIEFKVRNETNVLEVIINR